MQSIDSNVDWNEDRRAKSHSICSTGKKVLDRSFLTRKKKKEKEKKKLKIIISKFIGQRAND